MNQNIKLIENYRDNELHRNQFFHFISKVFPKISFEEWYEKGFWTDDYTPISITDPRKIIANASITLMNVIINGKEHKAAQIGTVATLPEFRGQGLSNYLMKYIFDKYETKVDFFFLYANEDVINFYPKYGFKEVKENLFIQNVKFKKEEPRTRKLNIVNEDDYSLLLSVLNNSKPITKRFGSYNYSSITMWHVLNIYHDNLYYFEKENAIIIKQMTSDTLHLLEVFFTIPFDLKSILPNIIDHDSVKYVKLYFPPDIFNYKYDEVIEENTLLFIKGSVEINCVSFRFPVTAVT